MEECFVHYTSVGKEEKLLSLSSKSAWETVLNAARYKTNEKVIALAASIMKRSIHKLDFIKLVALCLQ